MCDDKKLWLFLNYFAVKFRSKPGHFKPFQSQNGLILHISIWQHSTSTEDASGCPVQNIMLMKFEHGSVLSGSGSGCGLAEDWRVLIFNEISAAV